MSSFSRSSKVFPDVYLTTRLMAARMCSKRSLSLSCSLINQLSVTFNTFAGKGSK